MPDLLFIARSWHGKGGMQRFDRGLASSLQEHSSLVRIHHPLSRGMFSQILFLISSWVRACIAIARGHRVHFSDAGIAMISVCLPRARRYCSVTVHGLDVIYQPSMYQYLIRMMLRRMQTVVCVSRATALEVQNRGVESERTVVIPPGIFADQPVSRQSDDLRLLTVGRLIERKGVAWFVDAVLPRLIKKYPTLRYDIVGDGPERSAIEECVERHQLQDCVVLHGEVSDADRERLLGCATCMVVPNISVSHDMEGFGIVCLEAGSAGVPVLAAEVDGLIDAVQEGVTGLLYQAGNADECIRVFDLLLAEQWDANAIANAVVQRHQWSRIVALYDAHVFALP